MGRSLESSRPILAENNSIKRASQRFSTYSVTPSVAFSERTVNTTTSSNDPRITEIKDLTDGLDRLEVKRLQQQRFVPSKDKTEMLSKLALGAKLERALGRRMTGQDATHRPKVVSEKPARRISVAQDITREQVMSEKVAVK